MYFYSYSDTRNPYKEDDKEKVDVYTTFYFSYPLNKQQYYTTYRKCYYCKEIQEERENYCFNKIILENLKGGISTGSFTYHVEDRKQIYTSQKFIDSDNLFPSGSYSNHSTFVVYVTPNGILYNMVYINTNVPIFMNKEEAEYYITTGQGLDKALNFYAQYPLKDISKINKDSLVQLANKIRVEQGVTTKITPIEMSILLNKKQINFEIFIF